MAEISIEKIVSLVVREVVSELKRQGIQVTVSNAGGMMSNASSPEDIFKTKSQKIDMSKYKTPVLTENHLMHLHELTGEIIIPKGTVITPKARQKIREKNLSVKIES